MFGFIKNLFRKQSAQEHPLQADASQAPVHHTPSPSTPPQLSPQGLKGPDLQNPLAQAPLAPPSIAAEAPAPLLRPRPKGKMERVLLPLKTITDAFPEALQPLIAETPEASVMIALPVDRIIAQLPKGRVEVAISQLRRVAPPTIFIAETDWDDQTVEIPLRELLPKLDPALLKRNTQRRIDLPLEEDVFQRRRSAQEAGVAGAEDENADLDMTGGDLGMTIDAPTEEETAAEVAASPAPAPTPAPVPLAPQGSISAPREMQALFGSRPPAQQPQVPPPIPAPAVAHSLPVKLPTAPAAPVPIPLRPIPGPAKPATSGPVTPTAAPVTPAGQPAPIALHLQPKPVPVAAPPVAANPLNPLSLSTPAPTPTGGVVLLPIYDVSAHWPQAIRDEIAALGGDARIEFPLDRLGAALKKGKVALHWKELRSWVPAIHAAPSAYDDAFLELPLPIVAPLFMAASAGGRTAPQRRTVVDESIPSPFTPAAPVAPEPEPVQEPVPAATAPVPLEAEAKPTITLPSKPAGALGLDDSIPSTLVERACALSGVAGSVIALKDGLLVAAKTPDDFQAETIAAFLPQVFSRVESAAGSMQIGEFQTLMFTAGDRPWQIWKAGSLFFAAIGRPNELLPSAQLKIIAGQLARQTKG